MLGMDKPWRIEQSHLAETTQQAVERKLGHVVGPFDDVAICTHREDPQKDESLRSHFGENIRILRLFVHSTAFKLILQQVKQTLRNRKLEEAA